MTGPVAPSAERNRAPLFDALSPLLRDGARVLELASGTGQHGRYFTDRRADLVWQPSDLDPERRAAIEAWRTGAGPGLLPPLALDVLAAPWPVPADARFDAVLAVNLLQVSPPQTAAALFAGAGSHLSDQGIVCLYGPFAEGGRHVSPGNAAFDADLRRRHRGWGVRDVDAVAAQATGFRLARKIAMPANNRVLIFAQSLANG